jgi:hypothetical protein
MKSLKGCLSAVGDRINLPRHILYFVVAVLAYIMGLVGIFEAVPEWIQLVAFLGALPLTVDHLSLMNLKILALCFRNFNVWFSFMYLAIFATCSSLLMLNRPQPLFPILTLMIMSMLSVNMLLFDSMPGHIRSQQTKVGLPFAAIFLVIVEVGIMSEGISTTDIVFTVGVWHVSLKALTLTSSKQLYTVHYIGAYRF